MQLRKPVLLLIGVFGVGDCSAECDDDFDKGSFDWAVRAYGQDNCTSRMLSRAGHGPAPCEEIDPFGVMSVQWYNGKHCKVGLYYDKCHGVKNEIKNKHEGWFTKGELYNDTLEMKRGPTHWSVKCDKHWDD